MSNKKNHLRCERCEKACSARLPDPLVEVERFDGFNKMIGKSAQLICIKCVDKARREAGETKRKLPSKASVRKRDEAANLKLWRGDYDEHK